MKTQEGVQLRKVVKHERRKVKFVTQLLEQSCMMNMKSSRTSSRMIKFEFLCVENVNKICLHSGKKYRSSIVS